MEDKRRLKRLYEETSHWIGGGAYFSEKRAAIFATLGIRTANLVIFGAVGIGRNVGCEMCPSAAVTDECMTIGGICIDAPSSSHPGRHLDLTVRWRTK